MICVTLFTAAAHAQVFDNPNINCNLNGLTGMQDAPDLRLTNVFSGNPTVELEVMGPNPANLPNAHLESTTAKRFLKNADRLSKYYIRIDGKAASGCKPSGWEAKETIKIFYYPLNRKNDYNGMVIMEDQDGTTIGECHYEVKN